MYYVCFSVFRAKVICSHFSRTSAMYAHVYLRHQMRAPNAPRSSRVRASRTHPRIAGKRETEFVNLAKSIAKSRSSQSYVKSERLQEPKRS